MQIECDVELVVMLSCPAPRRGAARLFKCVQLHNRKEPWHGYDVLYTCGIETIILRYMEVIFVYENFNSDFRMVDLASRNLETSTI